MSLNLTSDLSADVLIFEEQVSTGIYIFSAITLGFIGCFGFVMNLLVIVTIFMDINVLWTPTNVILINMVIGDFLVAALGNPIAMASAIAGAWYWSHDMCMWYAWFMSTMGFASIGNLTVMAIERFLLVACPLKAFSLKHSYVLALLVWMYALCLSLPPFFNWGKYGLEAINISCSVSWELHDPGIHSDTYITFIFVLGFFLPVIVISGSYCGIVKILRDMRKRFSSSNRREIKIIRMVFLMILAFLIAWSPYAVLALATQYFHMRTSPVVAVLPTLFAKSSICYNPIIYACLNVQFRQVWRKIFFMNTSRIRTIRTDMTTLNIQMTDLNRRQ